MEDSEPLKINISFFYGTFLIILLVNVFSFMLTAEVYPLWDSKNEEVVTFHLSGSFSRMQFCYSASWRMLLMLRWVGQRGYYFNE